MLDVWSATDGKVDSLESMFKYAEKRVGVIGKAFVDGEPQIPSVVIQGLKSTHYNNVLNGMAPLRAAVGNTTMIAVKPATAMMGTAFMKGDMKRALYQYSGFTEAFQRGLKGMSDTWRRTVANPETMGMTAREFQSSQIKDFEFMEAMAEQWMEEGDLGRVAAWNMGKMLSWWNGKLIQNWGVSALSAIDGFTNSFVASAGARARAYDEMFEATGGMMDPAALDKAQKQIYKSFFDEDGIIKDSAVAATTKEITMQLDNKLADGLANAMEHVPAIRGLFMFPKTGLNALEVAWSFNPVSGLGGAVGRVRKVMAAETTEEMMDALRAHGVNEFSQKAFDALKGEYIGRQMMGAAVVTGAGLMAVNGMLTGSGPQDKGQNRRMREMGWKPYSIKNPITGEWRSYQGLEPFDGILGLTADAVYHATRLDQRIYEDTLRKIGFAISMNITNKTFMSGLEPLTALSSTNDEGAWSRFFAMQTDALIPGTGIRSTLSKVITPQLKDVERDFLSTLANRNKWIFKDEATLINYRDFYTGKPVNGAGSWVEAVNRAMPIMRLSGGTEPWRQWLLAQGWDNLHVVTANPNMPKGTPITPRERQFIHDYVSKNNLVVPEIEKLMEKFGPDYSKKFVEQAKAAGHSDKDMPIGENYVHVQLDKIHRRAVKQAWDAMEKLNPDGKYTKAAEARRKKAARTGQTKRAADEATTLKKSLERDQQTLKALIEF